MGKITQVNNGDTGAAARAKINEAMKTVESDATLSGDGTAGNPLKAGSLIIIETRSPLSIDVIDVNIDFANANQFKSTNILAINSGATISLSNDSNSTKCEFVLDLTSAVIAFPVGFTMKDTRWDEGTRVFTATEDGIHNFKFIRYGAVYFLEVSGADSGGGGTSTDYENIFFEEIAPDNAYIVRGFNYKATAKSDYGGIITIVTSSDAAYTLGDTVAAGGYLKATSDTVNARTVLTIEAV